MAAVQSRELQHSVNPGCLQLSLSSPPSLCSSALRWIVLIDDQTCSVFLHAKSTSVSVGQNRPLCVDGQGVKIANTSGVSRHDRAGCLCLTSKWSLLLKGSGDMGHFIL